MFKLFRPRPPIIVNEARQVYDATYPIVKTSWHGVPILAIVRELSANQLWGIGNMSLIETFQDKIRMKATPSIEEMNAYAERHHKICKLCLVYPKYDDILAIAGAHVDDASISKQLEEIKRQWVLLPSGKEKADLKREYDGLELAAKLLLPAEFTAPIVAYITGATRTEIKDVTEETLYQLAILAHRGGNNPSDHISGQFERFPGDKFVMEDINNRAWVIFDERTKNLTKK